MSAPGLTPPITAWLLVPNSLAPMLPVVAPPLGPTWRDLLSPRAVPAERLMTDVFRDGAHALTHFTGDPDDDRPVNVRAGYLVDVTVRGPALITAWRPGRLYRHDSLRSLNFPSLEAANDWLTEMLHAATTGEDS